MIIRSWACLNRHCLHSWDGEGDHPPCPECRGIRVKWIPRPFAIKSEKTKAVDRSVAQLTSVYGDKDYRSPRRHESMAPKVNPSVTPGKTMRYNPAGGNAVAGAGIDMPIDQQGRPVAICAPTGVTAKLPVSGLEQKVGVSSRTHSKSGGTGAVPNYQARHQGPR
jgi:hypothetical protein